MRIILILAATCFLTCKGACQARIEADTVLANQYQNIGDSLIRISSYNDAINIYEKAKFIYEKHKLKKDYLFIKIKIAICYRQLSNYDISHSILRDVLGQIEEQFGEKNLIFSRALGEMGNLMNKTGKFDSALVFFKKALLIQKKELPGDDKDIYRTITHIGDAYTGLGKTDSALFYMRMGLKIVKSDLGENHLNVGIILFMIGNSHYNDKYYDSSFFYYSHAAKIFKTSDKYKIYAAYAHSSIGNCFQNKGNYDLSEKYRKEALEIIRSNFGENHPDVATTLMNLGVGQMFRGNYKLALEYYEKSLEIFKEKFQDHSVNMARCYRNISNVYANMGKPNLSIKFAKKGLQALSDFSGIDHPVLIGLYDNIGLRYVDQDSFELAKRYFSKSHEIIRKKYDVLHIDWANYFKNVSFINTGSNDFDMAIKNLKRSSSIYEKLFAGKHPEFSEILRQLGSIYLKKQEYYEALSYYQKSLVANISSFSDTSTNAQPKIEGSLNQNYTLISLKQKAITLEKIYSEGKNIERLKLSYNTLQLCDSLIDKLRNRHRNYEDKLALGKIALEVYETSIRVGLLLYVHTEAIEYLDRCFYFSEKNKSELLSKSLNDISAKRLGLLPDSLLSIEKNIKIDQTYYESQIVQQKVNMNKFDSVKFRNNNDRLFQLNRRHDSLVIAFEKNYPRYHQLKYQNSTLSIEKLQQKLSKNTALIEYFQGDSNLYVCAITKDDFKVSTVEGLDSIHQSIDEFRDVIGLWRNVNQSDKVHSKYVASASSLYNQLIKNSLDKLVQYDVIENLIIVPDGKLSYIPFELLITDDTYKTTNDYSSLNYLIKDYNISYGYSATLLYQDKIKSDREVAERNYLGFAPSYENTETDSSRMLALGKFRDAVSSLEWNQKEVEEATTYMGGDNRLAMNATETSFKQEVGKYNIVHLAMHAFIDDEDPMLSKLVFAQDELDTLNDGYLHTYELFNMEMNPDLVVLSACNTGYGKLEKGEGINSLAYAFAYAGCPSIVMSQWQVNDKSTSQLMINFYKNLSDGMDKSSALRKAKLEFLKNPGSPYANPSYWGGFVLIGDTDPIDLNKNQYLWILIGSVLGLALLSAVYFRNRIS